MKLTQTVINRFRATMTTKELRSILLQHWGVTPESDDVPNVAVNRESKTSRVFSRAFISDKPGAGGVPVSTKYTLEGPQVDDAVAKAFNLSIDNAFVLEALLEDGKTAAVVLTWTEPKDSIQLDPSAKFKG
jgi:hypothetical protein